MVRTTEDVESTINEYGDTVFKIALSHVKDYATAEDISQNVFIKYMLGKTMYNDENHKKAWLIRVTINDCKKHFRSFWNKNRAELSDVAVETNDLNEEVFCAVMSLPIKYRIGIHLYYYEELSIKEISKILKRKENTIMSDLHRARKILRKKLGDNYG